MPTYVALRLLPTLGKVLNRSFYAGFFHLETKKEVAGCVRQVVVLHSDDCVEICLGRLSIGRLRRVVVLNRLYCSIKCY